MYTFSNRESYSFLKKSVTYFLFSKCECTLSNEKIEELKEDTTFIEECCKEFQKKYPYHPFKYIIEERPEIWFQIFIISLSNTPDNQDVKVPNGCCNSMTCPINLFYEIIYKKITK